MTTVPFGKNESPVSSSAKTDGEVRLSETVGRDSRLSFAGRVEIRSISDLTTPPKVLTKDLYFEGLTVCQCHDGRVRFVVGLNDPVEMTRGDIFVIYPNQKVSIEALEASNRLVYGVFYGEGVTDYFDALGYFDRMFGRAGFQLENTQVLCEMLRNPKYGTPEGRDVLMSYLTDILRSFASDVRSNTVPLLHDAIWQIRRNLNERLVRLEPLCGALRVSRTHLTQVFAKANLGTPAAFVRSEQLRLAIRLLSEKSMSVKEISAMAGFISTSHFAAFVKRYTGKRPIDFRHRIVAS